MTIRRVHELAKLPQRPDDGHKGLFGRILVAGGNGAMIGAPVLSATACLRMGAGLVQIATPAAILQACLTITPELIGLPLSGTSSFKALTQAIDQADAIAIGPGMGQSKLSRDVVALAMQCREKSAVFDADALNLLATEKRWPKKFKASAVLTPHPGEMSRLLKLIGHGPLTADRDVRITAAVQAAQAFEQVVVLKGHETVVTDGERYYLNTTGDSTLAKAGSGDVLTGILATLLGQGMDRFDAACIAVWIHGKAGELAGQAIGQRCALARDVISHLFTAISQFEAL